MDTYHMHWSNISQVMCCQVARTLLDYGLPFEVQSFSGCVFGEGELVEDGKW